MIEEMKGKKSCEMVSGIVKGMESSGEIMVLEDKIAYRELKTTRMITKW